MPATASARLPSVIGLVITVRPGAPALETTLADLGSRPELRVAPARGAWIAVTADTDDPRELHRWLEARPGVAAVDVVFVELPPDAGASPPRETQRHTEDDFATPRFTQMPAS
jgi:hypothetical protein